VCSTHKRSTEKGLVQFQIIERERGSSPNPRRFFLFSLKNSAFLDILQLKFCLKASKIYSLSRVKNLNDPEKVTPRKKWLDQALQKTPASPVSPPIN